MKFKLITFFKSVSAYFLVYKKTIIKVVGGVTLILALLLIDSTDVFSNLGVFEHINTNNYIELISAIIGGIIAFYIAKYQIEKTNEESKNNEKESLRIQNLPILKYEVDTDNKSNGDVGELLLTNLNNNDSGSYELNLSIENIGNSTIRNLKAFICSDVLGLKYQSLMDNNSINPMKSGDVININRFISLNRDTSYEFQYIIYYQDILLNWYKQIINVNYRATSIFNGNYKGNASKKVEEEILIDSKILNSEIETMRENKKNE